MTIRSKDTRWAGVVAVALLGCFVLSAGCEKQPTDGGALTGGTQPPVDNTSNPPATPPVIDPPAVKTPVVETPAPTAPSTTPVRRRAWPASALIGWVKVHVSITAAAQNRIDPGAYRPSDMSTAAECANLNINRPATQRVQRVTVGENGVLKDVVVYVSGGLENFNLPPISGPFRLAMLRCNFFPRVYGIRTGQQLLVRNGDSFPHNVRANGGGASFNITMDRPSEIIPESLFSEPEMGVTLQSDIYPWMRSYACVMTHPCFGVSTERGLAEFDCPAGDVEISVWHEPVEGLVDPKPKKLEVLPNRDGNRAATLMIFKYE